jgi:hypothetical protein
VGGGRVAQGLQIIAAFEQRYDAAVGEPVGHIHELLRRPDEIGLFEFDVGEWIAVVRVEAGGNDDQFRAEVGKPRQDAALERGAKRVAAVARAQRLCSPDSPTAPVPGNSGI